MKIGTTPGRIRSGLQPRNTIIPITRSPNPSIRVRNFDFATMVKILALINVAVSAIESINKGI